MCEQSPAGGLPSRRPAGTIFLPRPGRSTRLQGWWRGARGLKSMGGLRGTFSRGSRLKTNACQIGE